MINNLHVYCPETQSLHFNAPVETYHQGNVIHHYNEDRDVQSQSRPLPSGAEGGEAPIINEGMYTVQRLKLWYIQGPMQCKCMLTCADL